MFKPIPPQDYDRRKHFISFRNAFNGILLAFETQPNFRFHAFAFFIVMVLSAYLRISALEFLLVFFISVLVFCMEMFNTAVEAIGDEIADGKYSKLVGVAKDVSAGGVLISAFAAVVIGILIFGPRIALIISY